MNLRPQPLNLTFLFLLTALLAGLCIWLLGNNFVNDIASLRWAKVLGIMDAERTYLENLRLIYPHAPYYMLMPFAFLEQLGVDRGAAPYFVSCLVAALFLTVWNSQMRNTDLAGWKRALLILAVLVQPTFLWAATNGSHTAISMMMFYFLYRACLRMIYEEDVRSFILLGLVLAAYFFVDPVALFLFVALLPMLAFIAPKRILVEAPVSVYIIICMPLGVAVGSWLYLNWIFEGNALSFIYSPESAFTGGWQDVPESSWLRTWGGQWFGPLIQSLWLVAVFFPAVFVLFVLAARYTRHVRASLILMLHPLVAIAFATSKFYLFHSLEILTLIIAGIMAELTVLPFSRPWKFPLMLGLLLAGSVTGWMAFGNIGYTPAERWTQAFVQPLDNIHSADQALGQFLATRRAPTLLDDRSAYHAMVVRGDAEQLYLPTSDRFKIELRRDVPTIGLIAIPDSATERGRRDRINQRHPTLYDQGMPGYKRIYDYQGWRVYSHDAN